MKFIPILLLIFIVSVGLSISIAEPIHNGGTVNIPGTDKFCTNTVVVDNYLYCNIDDVRDYG